MPQVYWSDQYGPDGKTRMFTDRIELYAGLKRQKTVMLYAGLALYQSGEELDLDKGWTLSSSNISEQVQILSNNGYKGYSLFNYSSLLKEDGEKEMRELLRAHPYN